MEEKVMPRIGDLYCICVDNKFNTYIQYVAKDKCRNNNIVIRVFKTRYPIDFTPYFEDIVKDDVLFYAYYFMYGGIREWESFKVGNAKVHNKDEVNNILFTFPQDVILVDKEYVDVNPYDNWLVWKIGTKGAIIGSLPEDLKDSVEYGGTIDFDDLMDRIKYGYYKKMRSIFYSVVKRKPFPFVDSFVKQSIEGVSRYYHFHGEEPVRQIIDEDVIKLLLSKDNPQYKEFKMRTKPFSSTNWKFNEFIEEKEFNWKWDKMQITGNN